MSIFPTSRNVDQYLLAPMLLGWSSVWEDNQTQGGLLCYCVIALSPDGKQLSIVYDE